MRNDKIRHKRKAILVPLLGNTKQAKPLKKLALSMQNSIILIEVDDILYLKADSNYTHVHMVNGNQHTCCTSLKKFTQKMGDQFFRIHQSYLLNSKYIRRYDFSKNSLEVQNGDQLPVSRINKSMVSSYMKQWSMDYGLRDKMNPRINIPFLTTVPIECGWPQTLAFLVSMVLKMGIGINYLIYFTIEIKA